MDIQQIVQRQHDYFATGATLDVKGRLAALDRLRTAIEKLSLIHISGQRGRHQRGRHYGRGERLYRNAK